MQDVYVRVRQIVGLLYVVPPITTPQYTAGDSVGGIQTLPNAYGELRSLTILDKANQKAPFDVLLFKTSPNAATTTDNAPFVWSTDDLNLIGRVSIATGDYVTIASEAVAQKSGLSLILKSAGDSTIYAVAVTSGTPTYTVGALQFVWGTLTS